MTATPFHDIAQRARAAVMKGTRLHLEEAHARILATDPEIAALFARRAAEELAQQCPASPPTTDSPPLPLFPPEPGPSPMPSAPPPPVRTGLESTGRNSGSNGGPSGSNMPSPGTIEPLVSAAASSQVLDQVQQLIHQGRQSKRSQRTTPPAPARPNRRRRPRLALAQS